MQISQDLAVADSPILVLYRLCNFGTCVVIVLMVTVCDVGGDDGCCY